MRLIFLLPLILIAFIGCQTTDNYYKETLNGKYKDGFANEKHNIIIYSQNKDFGNKFFSNNKKGCGQKNYQKGHRKREAILFLSGENFVVENGTFDCSYQNTIYVQRAKNLVIQNVTSSRGSDNPIEIRDSFVFVQNSTFKDSIDNKCVETENGIVVFYNNTFSNCRLGHDMELTKSQFWVSGKKYELNYSAVVFLKNKFLKIRDDAFHCHDRRKNGSGNVFLFLKNNTFSGSRKIGYTFRKFGKNRTCLKVINISNELENAIISSNTSKIYEIIRKTIKQSIQSS